MADWTFLLHLLGYVTVSVACIALGYKAGLRRARKQEVANTMAGFMNQRLLTRTRELEAGVASAIDTLETLTSVSDPDETPLPQAKVDLAETVLVRLHRIRFSS